MPPIEIVKGILKCKIEDCERKINQSIEKQNESFTHAFEWGSFSDRYWNEGYKANLQSVLARTDNENFLQFLTHYRMQINRYVMSYDPTSISTSPSRNIADSLKHTVYVAIVELCDVLIESLQTA